MEQRLSFWIHENSEIKLVKKAIRGDGEAFIEVVKLHKSFFYKLAYSYVKNDQKALDVLQECTYKGLIHIHTLKNPSYFKTWFTKIIIHEAINMSKKENRLIYLEEEVDLPAKTNSLSIEMKLDLYDAINVLREDYKTVIILMYFNEYSIEEISNMMDIPPNTVKSHLRRAKQQLNHLLKEELS